MQRISEQMFSRPPSPRRLWTRTVGGVLLSALLRHRTCWFLSRSVSGYQSVGLLVPHILPVGPLSGWTRVRTSFDPHPQRIPTRYRVDGHNPENAARLLSAPSVDLLFRQVT